MHKSIASSCLLAVSLFGPGLAVRSAEAQTVYASVPGSSTVLVLQGGSVTGSIAIPPATAGGAASSPSFIAVTPDAKYAYVIDSAGAAVDVIDTVANAVISTINIRGCPTEIAFSPDGSIAYLSQQCTNATGMSILDTAAKNVSNVFLTGSVFSGSVAFNPFGTGVAVSPDGSKVYFGTYLGLGVYDTVAQAATLANISFAGGNAGKGGPCDVDEVAITPDGNQLIVTACLDAYAVATTSFTTTLLGATRPFSALCTSGGVAITPDGARAFVTDQECGGGLVVDLSNHTATNSLGISDARYLAITSDSALGYAGQGVEGEIGDIVQEFNATTGSFFGNVSIAGIPVGVAVMPYNNTFPPPNQAPVTPLDKLTNTSPVTVTFEGTVTQAGYTSLFINSSGPALPAGLQLATPPVYYDLATTALFIGNIQICITNPAVTSSTTLVHFTSSGPVDITSQPVTPPTICGVASSLSPFAILQSPTAPTTTVLSSAPTSSVFGQQVSFTALVSPTSGSPFTPSGNVTFNDGATALGTGSLSSGTAIFNTSSLSVGTHTISATYPGDSNFSSSTSNALSQVVAQGNTVTTVSGSPNPASLGQPITFTATVSAVAPAAGTPSTTVTFFDGATPIGSGMLAGGQASFTTSALSVGAHSITAVYSGDANFLGSTSVVFTATVYLLQSPVFTSAPQATFTVGTPGTFTVTASGSPTPTLSTPGPLPTGVNFTDNGNGTAALAGTPAPGTGGSYAFTISANNGVGAPVLQSFTLTVDQAPAITSGGGTTFTEGVAGSFTLTTTGFPISTLSETPPLPSGLNFVDNVDGTASLSGTPAVGTQGSYAITFTAANGVGTNATQNFTLAINLGPAITSGSSTTFTEQVPGSFLVTTLGFPVPTLTYTGQLPTGVNFTDNHDGTATLAGTPAAGTSNIYPITIIANNGVGAPTTQAFTLAVNSTAAITSGSTTTFTVGSAGFFSITTTGSPTPTLTRTGMLPTGVAFMDNGNGTATLSGTPAAGTANSYPLTITANNGVGTPAMQMFTLVVNQGAAILSGNATTFTVGVPGTFTVMTSGSPTPTLTETPPLPAGLMFMDNGDGTGTLSGIPAAGTGGAYPITFTANNGVGTPAMQSFSLTVNQGPARNLVGEARSVC